MPDFSELDKTITPLSPAKPPRKTAERRKPPTAARRSRQPRRVPDDEQPPHLDEYASGQRQRAGVEIVVF